MLAAIVALVCATHLSADVDQGQNSGQQQVSRSAAQASAESEMQKAVDEFKTVTRELGLRPDSPKKKGSNGGVKAAWHGRVFENFRNDFLDAVPHEVKQQGEDASTLRRNQFGFNVAGPVIIPRLYDGRRATFFSLSYEGVRENIARSILTTIPTMAQRTGDFSGTVDSAGAMLRVYDPLTTQKNPAYDSSLVVSETNLEYRREVFPGNVIPKSRLDQVALKALDYYPAPNASVGPFNKNNYFIHSPEGNEANGMIGKVDHTLLERHRVSFGTSYSNGLLTAVKYFPTEGSPGSPDRSFNNRSGSLEYVFTISPRTVNTFTFEATSNGSKSGADDSTNYSELLGLAGAPGSEFPVLYLSGAYLQMGKWSPVANNVRNSFEFTDSFSSRRGKHSLYLSMYAIRQQVNTYQPSSPAGQYNFGSDITALPGITNTGDPFASFMLGMAEYGAETIVGSPSYFRSSATTLTARHSYEARRGLTFSVATNVHTSWPRVEKYDRQSTVDLTATNPGNGLPGALVFADRNGYGRRLQPVRTKLEPSLGIAWNPGGGTKSVVRLNYWRAYSGVPLYFGQWGTNGFNANPTYITDNSYLTPAVTLSEGMPVWSGALPDLRGDAVNGSIGDLMQLDPGRQPMSQGAQLTVERELPGSLVVTAGALYTGGKDQYVSGNVANPNAITLDALQYRDQLNSEAFRSTLRPFPQYLAFELAGLYAYGKYQRDAGFLRVEKRASQGLTLSAAYTFSKSMDDYSGPYGVQDFYNRQNDWSLTSWNTPQSLSVTYTYELPFGSNRPLLAYSDWRRYLVDGWSVSGVATVYSGEPLALVPEFNNTGGVVTALNVNVVPGIDPRVPNPSPDQWFNPAAFDQPADFTIGNASRTSPVLRGPISQNQDLSLIKRFALAPDRSVEFSAVGLNFLNHANWTEPDTTIGPASAPNLNAGKIIGSRGGRVVQLGIRISF